MILLRFRDLSIPEGETIRRHRDVIETRGYVWWGWITRGHEVHPVDALCGLSRDAAKDGTTVGLVHTGSSDVFRGKLTAVHGDLMGTRTLTPEIDCTPAYMHESRCPIWFRLAGLEASDSRTFRRVLSLPTLGARSTFDAELMTREHIPSSVFSQSDATLWEIDP